MSLSNTAGYGKEKQKEKHSQQSGITYPHIFLKKEWINSNISLAYDRHNQPNHVKHENLILLQVQS